MCGLFGYRISNEGLEDVNLHTLLASLAYTAERRGNESWGVLKYDQQHTHSIVKAVGSIRKTCRIKDIVDLQILGHTRKATVGAISVPNAHPFHIGKIIGVHNGFVEDYTTLNATFKRDYQVDSQHIFAHLDAGLALSTLSASGTIVYVNTDNLNEIYFGRGESSTLAIFGIGMAENCRGLIWSSSIEWAEEALALAGSCDHFLYDTKPSMLYRSNGYGLDEVGAFTLQFHARSYDTFPIVISRYLEERQQRINDVCNSYKILGRNDVLQLPDSLKKTQEVIGMDQQEEASQAYSSTTRCHGCGYWGTSVEDFKNNTGGVSYYPSTAEYLCFSCAAFWESETGSTGIAIPSLKLMMQDYDEI